MNLQRIWEIGRGWGILISDSVCYRNHYMSSGEATSLLVLDEIERYCDEMMREKFLHNMPSKKAMNKTLYIVHNQNVPR